ECVAGDVLGATGAAQDGGRVSRTSGQRGGGRERGDVGRRVVRDGSCYRRGAGTGEREGGGARDRAGAHRLAEGRRYRRAGSNAGGAAGRREAGDGGRRRVRDRGEGPDHVGAERIASEILNAAVAAEDGRGVGRTSGQRAGGGECGGVGAGVVRDGRRHR